MSSGEAVSGGSLIGWEILSDEERAAFRQQLLIESAKVSLGAAALARAWGGQIEGAERLRAATSRLTLKQLARAAALLEELGELFEADGTQAVARVVDSGISPDEEARRPLPEPVTEPTAVGFGAGGNAPPDAAAAEVSWQGRRTKPIEDHFRRFLAIAYGSDAQHDFGQYDRQQLETLLRSLASQYKERLPEADRSSASLGRFYGFIDGRTDKQIADDEQVSYASVYSSRTKLAEDFRRRLGRDRLMALLGTLGSPDARAHEDDALGEEAGEKGNFEQVVRDFCDRLDGVEDGVVDQLVEHLFADGTRPIIDRELDRLFGRIKQQYFMMPREAQSAIPRIHRIAFAKVIGYAPGVNRPMRGALVRQQFEEEYRQLDSTYEAGVAGIMSALAQ